MANQQASGDGASGSARTQFKPGQSGNPGGKSKGFATIIKGLCGDDYEKIATGFALIAWGSDEQRREFFGTTVKVSAKDRLIAMRELRDSGPGRPVQTLDHRGNVPAATRVIHEEPADLELPAAQAEAS